MLTEIQFIGEHLFIGNLGHFLVVLSFISALLSGLFYLRQEKDASAKKLGRIFFGVHVASVIGVFTSLFIIIQNHYFEYSYAYEHSSLALPLKYMVSCFWEGQEGSFLLWIVWNALLGVILMFTAKKWENGVMPIMALAQLILVAMLLGVEFSSSYTLGSSPFTLLRDKMAGTAPIFSQANYLEFITDGTGLNPLLQNYWMVIHPPTLFLGFALTVVPFAFAVTALFRKEHRAWIKPALPWALVAGMVLGAGIIMGGFWAYESLSFGGYWAWDPVENASLVPWLLLIAGIHLMLIKKVTNTSTIASYILIIASFILVLYATFLTRSGVLGETSVHSFTDLGLGGQLMQLVVIFVWLPIIAVTRQRNARALVIALIGVLILVLPFYTKISFYPILIFSLAGIVWFGLVINKEINNHKSEDNIWSREFWMFIGSLILVLSAMQVTITTSIPVFNKIFGTSAAPPSDAIAHYNKFQLPFAIVIAILTAVGQYFKYRNTEDKLKFKKDLLILLAVSVLLTIGGMFLFGLSNYLLILFLWSALYALVSNAYYALAYLKGRVKFTGASITHVGFALMLVGVLVSSSKKRVITADFAGSMANFTEDARRENMLLFKGESEKLGDYMVTYVGDSTSGPDLFFKVNYKSVDGKEEFTLYPNTQIGSNEGLMPNPDTRHYLTYDVYTHITALPKPPDTIAWGEERMYVVDKGDSIYTENGTVVFNSIEVADKDPKLNGAFLIKANIDVVIGDEVVKASPVCVQYADTTLMELKDELVEEGIRIGYSIANAENGLESRIKVALAPAQSKYIVMKAIVFPYINLLWLGTILMIIGFGVAAYNRLELKRGS